MTSNTKYDPNYTQNVIDAIGPATSPRVRQLMGSLIQHLHDFARENEVTFEELMASLDMVNRAGKMSDDKRNETLLLLDIIGIESLLDEISAKRERLMNKEATASSLLGPFFRHDAPTRENESSIVQSHDNGEITYMHGIVSDEVTKLPLNGAWVDVWQASTNGLYEQQDENQVEHNLRGKFKTDENGHYGFYCLRPSAYPIPSDGPAGDLMKLLDRHPFRPAHIHIMAQCDGYQSLTTQVYDRSDPYLKNDAVFAVKESLIVDFKPKDGNPKAKLDLEFPIFLVPSSCR